MRRVFLLILCLCLLTTAVCAAGTVSELQSNAFVSADGTCQISVEISLTMDGTESDLRFPLPGTAKDITLNGSAAKTSRSDSRRWVDLSSVIYGAGNYTLYLHYSLPDLVAKQEKGGLLLTLPLLSGFAYPIDQMDFSITLPGAPEAVPFFSSTYHPESMESVMEYTVEGNVISGNFLQGLNDHETLTMTLAVSDDMFPQNIVKRWSLSYDDLLQYALIILALAYWLIFLRCPLPRRVRRLQSPDGMSAGQLGCVLSGLGVDFSMMVLSWAQMGYLSIHMDRHNRVLLYKNMDMGNERSEFEVRAFKTLFGKRDKVDGSGEHYARLGRKAAKTIPGAWHYFKKSSGNPLIFRCIAVLIGAVSGYSLAVAFATDTAWQVVLAVLLVPLGAVLSWLIQTGMRGIHLRHRLDLLIGIGSAALWLFLSLIAGEGIVGFLVVASQALAGIAAIHGGRRTESGLQARNEILGLRKYLRSVTPDELYRIMETNPEYYFAMAPDALALGVDRAFARQFGREKLPECPYLSVYGRTSLSARQWNELLRQTVRILDARQRKLVWEKLFGKR